MNKLLLSSLAIVASLGLSAQKQCYTTEMQNDWFAKHPELRAVFDRQQQDAADLDKELYKTGYNMAYRSATAAGNYTIPVVFHILHLGGGENISDAQVIDAVKILTRDFNADNADTSSVVVQFKNLIGNPKFDFALATKDPNGNCTNGIIRHYDANTDWDSNPSNYIYTWPPHRYLNVYVVRTIGSGAAGYTFLPGSGVPNSMDAIVILSNYVGSIGSGSGYTSRALTHEVGHWFNLPHVWGGTNQPGVACGDDGVSDTPITKGYTSCNLANAAICTPGVIENMQNYMDYAYCQRMFTIGQATRMLNAINSPINGRNNLSSNNNLALTGVTNPGVGCVPEVDLIPAPSYTVCSGKSLVISTFTSNANPTGYAWSADNGAVVANPSAASTSILFNNPGTTQVSCIVSNGSGSKSQTISITVLDGTTDILTSNQESFEAAGVDPPTLWQNISPTSPSLKWEVMHLAASDGLVSMYAPGEALPANAIVILESPSYDFKHNPGALFSFKYAYARQNTNNADVFKVQASKNCGGTWTDVWVPSNSSLAQGSGGTTSDLYYPSDTDWKLKVINQQPQFFQFTTEENVRFRFFFQENVGGTTSGNRFYLDDVNFASPVGINELTKAIDLNVYPNPSHAGFNLSFRLADASRVSYKVSSVTGAVLISEAEKVYTEGAHEFRLNDNAQLKAGIYFVTMELNGVKMTRKIIVE